MATRTLLGPPANGHGPTVSMAATTDASHRSRDGAQDLASTRVVPVPTPEIQMSAPSPAEPMDVGSPTMHDNIPPESASDGGNANGHALNGSSPAPAPVSATGNPIPSEQLSNANSNSMPAPPAAAAAVHQPKIVQTAFIHKLYK